MAKKPSSRDYAAIRALVERWRDKELKSREESGRIRRTIKEATGAEERCLVRAEVWHNCADDLTAECVSYREFLDKF